MFHVEFFVEYILWNVMVVPRETDLLLIACITVMTKYLFHVEW